MNTIALVTPGGLRQACQVPGPDRVPILFSLSRLLGHHPEERFTEAEPQQPIRAFQRELEDIHKRIEERNYKAELRYNCRNPQEIENSISI